MLRPMTRLTICSAWFLLLTASASATTVTLGPPVPVTLGADRTCEQTFPPPCLSLTLVQRALPDPSVTDTAPADGKVVSWRASGEGKLRLRVLHPSGESLIAAGTSALAADLKGGPNTTSLPIHAGDLIGVDLESTESKRSVVGIETIDEATYSQFSPAIPEDGAPHTPFNEAGDEFFFNASVVLAPTVAAIAPASGSNTGGTSVKIFGTSLDGATGVSFGSAPASSFTVDSANQITAISPAVPASTVDVRVIGPGGTSAPSSADQYTFVAPPAPAGSTPTLVSALPTATGGRPTLTALGQSSSRWRRGNLLPKISRANAPVGTTFSFSLSKEATVRLLFTKRVAGRKVRGRCRAPGASNVGKPKCTRTVAAGTLSLQGHVGLNKLSFQGRLSGSKILGVGRYTLALTARDASGLQSQPRSLNFTIVG